MMPALPPEFLHLPLAHRAMHDVDFGRPENSCAAIRAALAMGYGIEIDVQPSSDGIAMVFHDYELDRLTGETGPLRARSAAELGQIALTGGDEGIPMLAEVLAIVAGRVPLLVEIKDQDGAMGPDVGPLEAGVARVLASYQGPVAVMSFNPYSIAEMARLAPAVPRGLTTYGWTDDAAVAAVPEARREQLARIEDFDRVGGSFISHDQFALTAPRVVELRERGVPVLCWTVRSHKQAARALRKADNITFEGFLPAKLP